MLSPYFQSLLLTSPSRKFGKHLQKKQLDIPEYAASFVNYKALKKLIKKLSATPTLAPHNDVAHPGEPLDPQASLQANRATFFFRLERELEKVNAFYLQKEAELNLRLKTLLDKKKVMQSRATPTSKVSATFITLQEGFQQFGNDLNNLQQFVEVNATAFSKILKKWDKTSKSRTKELYLSRAVEVQPCFNRDVISELSDQATTSLLELAAWAEGEKIQFESRETEYVVTGQPLGTDESDTDFQFLQAINSGNIASLRDWISRLSGSPDAGDRFTRTFLSAIHEASDECLNILLETGLVDLSKEDEINERNCLHEAAISGKTFVLSVGLSKKVDPARRDIYGRIPLHYACLHGRVDMVEALLDAGPSTIDTADLDNFTPLIHAIIQHHLPCVKILISRHARIDPTGESDHVPLNLACQHGSRPVAELLLQRGAKVLPDAEGLYPQHLVARSGQTPELLLLLKEYGVDLDQMDKMYQWTPLFHAASEGHVKCLQILLESGVSVDALDEKDLSAMYYAAWEGHLECMQLLSARGGRPGGPRPATIRETISSIPNTEGPDPMSMDADGIPDLSLPPPIIPLRRYGHNFLDSKTFVQISFEAAASGSAIVFYHDSKYPAARLTISSKSSDLIPRNLVIPIEQDNRLISFQIDNLEAFTIDFDIFPTFGSRVIAKTVAVSNTFRGLSHSKGHCFLPLFDPRLRAIGEISFSFQVIEPYRGIPLEITHFATYWKATSQFDSQPNALITGSSLSGDYARLFVQLTSDLIPVLYPSWTVSHAGIEYPVGRLTYEQFVSIGALTGKGEEVSKKLREMRSGDVAQIHSLLSTSFVSLRDTLANLPTNIHVELQILFPTAIEEKTLRLGPTPNLNDFADAILNVIFDHARTSRETSPDMVRSIVLSSYNPDVCTALNWKQPNYPIFLCNDLSRPSNATTAITSSGRNAMSVKEAVRIAQSNNFMGLMLCESLLTMVPALISSIKVAGLILVADISTSVPTTRGAAVVPPFDGIAEGIDGVLRSEKGVLRFRDTIDV